MSEPMEPFIGKAIPVFSNERIINSRFSWKNFLQASLTSGALFLSSSLDGAYTNNAGELPLLSPPVFHLTMIAPHNISKSSSHRSDILH